MSNAGWSIEVETAPEAMASSGSELLSAVVIGPDDRRRHDVIFALQGPMCAEPQQMTVYPEMAQVGKIIESGFDVVMVELDTNPEAALDVIESVSSGSQATVMVYSSLSDSDLMIRCMRAGSREFLPMPTSVSSVAEALVRASARRNAARPVRKAAGRLCVFWGAKGGSGVTTIATNFAIATAQESGQSVLLIDLDLPLGDAVLNLGLSPHYSTVDALQNHVRLDANYLNRLTIRHESGISILPAPGKLVPVQFPSEAVDKLIHVARQEYDCIVVDTGSRFELTNTMLFDPIASVYLVSQVSVPELRNSNRLASEFLNAKAPKFEVVLNRFENSSLGLDEEQITKIITRKASWKIPNNYVAVRDMQTTAVPLAMTDAPIARVIRQMARAACGLPEKPVRKKKLMNLF
jgi:pilus assembly protein CpaE